MKRALMIAVLVLTAGTASARDWPTAARSATVTPRSASPVPVVAKLQPVVGSVKPAGRFANPLAHKSKFTGTFYNPVSGQFGTAKFRR